MSSLTTCAFCTFINAPESTICFICKKSLHLPAVSAPDYSEIKACPECSFFNESSDSICQFCGVVLVKATETKQEITVTDAGPSTIRICNDCSYQNDCRDIACQMCGRCLPIPTSEQENNVSNACSMCRKSFHNSGKNQVKISTTCSYHNSADAVKCSICKTKFGSGQENVLSKECPFCNHDNVPGVECTKCTFMNSIGVFHCVMCEELLQSANNVATDDNSTDEDVDTMDEEDSADIDVDVSTEYIEDDSMEESMEENISMDQGFVEDIADVVPTSTSAPTKSDDGNIPKYEVSPESFEMLETAPHTHKYFCYQAVSNNAKFLRAVTANIEILKTSVPPGIWIKAYEDRMDLLTFMIEGPNQTPYENGLFVFDIYLSHDFPSHPPKAHYISFWHERLNPNLYTEGKVCVSLLGTWAAQRKEEKWGPRSTLLQLIVSIQGLILVEQPYFNEPGYACQHGTVLGNKRSVSYNRRVIIGMIDSTIAMLANPPSVFEKEILLHFSKCGRRMYERLKRAVSKAPKETNIENFRLAIEKIVK